MEQHITCPACGTLAATLTLSTPHRIATQWRKPSPDLSEQMSRFVQERCVLQSDLSVSVVALRQAYSSWAEANGLEPISPKRFSMEISKLPGVVRSRNREVRLFTGVGVPAH